MNDKSFPDELSHEDLEAHLEDLRHLDVATFESRILGPVIEHDYRLAEDINFYGTTFKAGLHRLTLSANHQFIISYQGPGEEG